MTEWEALKKICKLSDELNLQVVDLDIFHRSCDVCGFELELGEKYREKLGGFYGFYAESLVELLETIETKRDLLED